MNAAPQSQIFDTLIQFRDDAVSALDRDAVPVYLFLSERFASTSDITSDSVFQFLFRSYYRLDNAGLSDDFKMQFFKLLQSHRAGPRPDLRQLCETLKPHKTKNQKEALQFSFATKLLATIDQERPIYDSLVASVFDFNPPYHVTDFSKRLDRFLAFYEILVATSQWLADEPKFKTVIAPFKERHARWAEVPLMKQIDFILWATGKAAKNAKGPMIPIPTSSNA